MGFGFRTLTFCGILLLAPVVLFGQGQSIELGIDGGLSLSLNDRTTTKTTIPIQSLRFGVFAFDRVSIEPSLALTVIDSQNTDPITNVSFWLSGLFHIFGDRSKPQPFLRPTGGVERYSSSSNSFSQFKAGAYLGVKIPVANHLSLRLESGYLRGFESDDMPSSDEVSLNRGF